jgi:beta-lactamase regulating signal transducer with metallopeptidase domain
VSILSQIPNAILNSLWLMSILYILYISVQFVFKLNGAKSFIVAVLFEIMATLHFLLSIFTHNQLNLTITTISINVSSSWVNSSYYIGLAYFFTLAIYCINLMIQFLKVADLRNNADYAINTFWNQELSKIGIGKYTIGQSNKVKSPSTFGWINTVILLPISILNHLSIEEVRFILLHEIAHIIRHDYFIQLFIKISHSILFLSLIHI